MREGGEASDKPIDSAVLSRMKQFRAMNKLKQLALKVCHRSWIKSKYIQYPLLVVLEIVEDFKFLFFIAIFKLCIYYNHS